MQNSWDDYQAFLAVAKRGSLLQASKLLAVNHTTIFRRINALEDKLKTKLFNRLTNGYELTDSGRQLYEEINIFDEKINETTLKIVGRDVNLKGKIRLAASDTIGFFVLPKILNKFALAYPEICVELIISAQTYDLSKREADLALRVSKNPSPFLFGKMIGKMPIGVLASRKYRKKISLQKMLEKEDWIIGAEQLENHPANNWLLQKCTSKKFIIAANYITAIANLVQHSKALAVLPSYLTRILPNLKLLHEIDELESKLWILTHQDLKNNARIKLLMNFLYDNLKEIIKYDKA
jgi:DNA-binding transcriptional LysR family regulator